MKYLSKIYYLSLARTIFIFMLGLMISKMALASAQLVDLSGEDCASPATSRVSAQLISSSGSAVLKRKRVNEDPAYSCKKSPNRDLGSPEKRIAITMAEQIGHATYSHHDLSSRGSRQSSCHWSESLRSKATINDLKILMARRVLTFCDDSDCKIVINFLNIESNKGNGAAIYLLSNAYFQGRGVEENIYAARKLLGWAAYFNHPRALNDYGYLLLHGVGGEKDYSQARECFRRATKLLVSDLEEKEQVFCNMIESPDGTPVVYQTFRPHSVAQFRYAAMLLRGLGGPQNIPLAQRYLNLSALNKCSKAIELLKFLDQKGFHFQS